MPVSAILKSQFATATDWREALSQAVEAQAAELVRVRRHLHSHPEPSGEEFATTQYLADRLEEAGIEHRLIPSHRGIVCDGVPSGGELRVAMRADTDALRIQDEKTADYRSRNEGIMHACGHDAHSAMVLGATKALHACGEVLPWPVPWRALFQPAEECCDGAQEMVAAGAVDGVRSIVALHVDPELPTGKVALRWGALTAFCRGIEAKVFGAGGHAARPHQARDAILAAAQFVTAAYAAVPRTVDAREPTVFSFGQVHGGDNANVLPDTVRLGGTIRTTDGQTLDRIVASLKNVAEAAALTTGTRIELSFPDGPDAVINDAAVTDVCAQAAASVVGAHNCVTVTLPSMGGEDFSGYLSHVPGAMMRLGVLGAGRPKTLLHTAAFDIDERALVIGAKLLATTLVRLAQPAA